MSNGFVTIPLAEYVSLQEDQRWRECVEGAGVDNWSGFDYAMADFYRDEEEDDD